MTMATNLNEPVDVANDAYVLLNDQPVKEKEHDCLGTAATAQKLAAVLRASKASSPFVLAIDAPWGMGKSTLLELISNQLMPESKQPKSKQSSLLKRVAVTCQRWFTFHSRHPDQLVKCVMFNAWTAESSSVLQTMITTVLSELDSNFARRWARKLARQRGLLSALRISFTIAAGFFGLSRAVDNLWSSLKISARTSNEMREMTQQVLGAWLGSDKSDDPKRALVVFVDDIDRCSDETVVQMCEVMKFYLDVKGLIFVLACDLTLLAHGKYSEIL